MKAFVALLVLVLCSVSAHAKDEYSPINGSNFYEFFGVSIFASAQDIKTAFRRKMRAVHPDSGGTVLDAQNANRAYQVLKTDRENYNTWLDHGGFAASAAGQPPPSHQRRPYSQWSWHEPHPQWRAYTQQPPQPPPLTADQIRKATLHAMVIAIGQRSQLAYYRMGPLNPFQMAEIAVVTFADFHTLLRPYGVQAEDMLFLLENYFFRPEAYFEFSRDSITALVYGIISAMKDQRLLGSNPEYARHLENLKITLEHKIRSTDLHSEWAMMLDQVYAYLQGRSYRSQLMSYPGFSSCEKNARKNP